MKPRTLKGREFAADLRSIYTVRSSPVRCPPRRCFYPSNQSARHLSCMAYISILYTTWSRCRAVRCVSTQSYGSPNTIHEALSNSSTGRRKNTTQRHSNAQFTITSLYSPVTFSRLKTGKTARMASLSPTVHQWLQRSNTPVHVLGTLFRSPGSQMQQHTHPLSIFIPQLRQTRLLHFLLTQWAHSMLQYLQSMLDLGAVEFRRLTVSNFHGVEVQSRRRRFFSAAPPSHLMSSFLIQSLNF